MFKQVEFQIFIRIFLLFVSITLASYLLISNNLNYLFLVGPIIIYQLVELYRYHFKGKKELDQFVESIRYRDFSRHFSVKKAPLELRALRESFNKITDAFKEISKEKETSFQYLQKILELVDTGIISFNLENGEIIWMNEALKKMLRLPYLKHIHSLANRDHELYEEVISLKPTESKIAVVHLESHSFKILLSGTTFQTDGNRFMLIAFQNINEALDETESKAWKKLLSVMTHEIMNSVAPISSLADTLKGRLQQAIPNLNDTGGTIHDLEVGIDTIKRRSEGLLKFAETYRNLNKIIKPNVKKVLVRDLFENLYQLMEPTLDKKNIEMDIVLKDTSLSVEVDPSLIEQVLINLVVNAIEALKDRENAMIVLSATSNNNKVAIKVADNGTGIPDDVLENIFIPFFSTKKTGSGIGLSLCKQIMMLHKGNINVHSVPGQGTAFTLQF
ncbi:sensor histidine kinase [Hanamia caeni]|jgi:signal transduction histidine kinase|uniref:histidine kinase n=1 Tax=Hanamia caeni TaxID=2294116 RepID=A0A3M9N942_9BACT|nr:HAMP domain-containing sensor histidine kinase [Hanamia caeni]RNI34261.1 sensor histidine kinase [Hanamia caeni]